MKRGLERMGTRLRVHKDELSVENDSCICEGREGPLHHHQASLDTIMAYRCPVLKVFPQNKDFKKISHCRLSCPLVS